MEALEKRLENQQEENARSVPWQSVLFLFILAFLTWFAFLGYRDLRDPDEGRYAEIPREMVATGDWLTPRLNGFKYFEKPPLNYWGTALFYKMLGTDQGVSRLWCAGLGFLGILWTFWLGQRLFGTREALYAALFLTSSLLYFAMGHMHTLDMGTSVFMTFGIGALLLAQSQRQNPGQVRNWMLVAWGSLAAATLSKGPMGVVLPAAAVTLYSLWQRDWALWRHLHLGKGLLFFLLLTAPWFVAVSLRNPEFPDFFFIREHWLRYTTTIHSRNASNFYFIPVLLAGSLPFMARAVTALARPAFAWRPADAGTFAPLRLLWVYIVFIFLFFSLSSSKLIPYILPVFPPLALLVGHHLVRIDPENVRLDLRILAVMTAILVGVAMLPDIIAHKSRLTPEILAQFRWWLLGGGGILAGGMLLVRHFQYQGKQAVITLAITALLAFQTIHAGYQTTSPVYSARQLATAMAPFVQSGTPVYSVDCFYHSLPFYLGQNVTLVRYKGELDFGIDQEPQHWISGMEAFYQQWRQAPRAVAVFHLRDGLFQQAQKELSPLRVIYQDTIRIAVAKP
ncbi:MAG: glycosyltransferase family 39 protein [Magnetococcales bacterium]|nr:glycosyltransferase family 39 protein [Magnetococcales bacterium]MBF0155096.1 glycosyltransferase family 39 protein [Magnetococcales bacterium]